MSSDNSQHTYRWTISSSDAMIQAQNTDVFKSDPFRIDSIEWCIECYPNGDSASCSGRFIILLRPTLIPTLWNQIQYCRRIKCVETECSDTAIAQTINTQNTVLRATGWDDENMYFNEFKQIIHTRKTLTIEITVFVLEVMLKNDHTLNVFPSIKTVNIPKQQTLQWHINSNLLRKIKSGREGQTVESDILNEMWCIRCSASCFFLQLCSLPHHIKSIQVQYVFRCIETNVTQQMQDIFSFDNHNSGPPNAMDINQIHPDKDITIVVHIKILRINLKNMKVEDDNAVSAVIDNRTEMNPHKEALKDLIECMKQQTQAPRYNRQTNKLQKLKKLVQSRYNADEIVIEQDHHQGNEHLNKHAIVRYLELQNDGSAIRNINILVAQKIMKQSDALQVFVIKENERNPALVGQKGLRANVHIPSGTVLGEYFGREFLENEFDDIYSGTQEFVDINEYALSATVLVKIRHSRLAFYTNTGMCYNDDENKTIKQSFSIVIDGLNKNSEIRAMLIFMNDSRKDINTTHQTVEDEQFQNVQLVTVNHNGWPKIFGVAIKNIPVNGELLTFYGSSHVGWEQDRIRYEQNQKLLVGNIKQMLNGHNIDLLD